MKRLRFTSILQLVLLPRLWLLLGIGLIVYSFVFERAGFIRQIQLKRENRQLQQQLVQAQTRMEALQAEIARLRTDVERLKQEAIRNGYAEPDEVIVRLR